MCLGRIYKLILKILFCKATTFEYRANDRQVKNLRNVLRDPQTTFHQEHADTSLG